MEIKDITIQWPLFIGIISMVILVLGTIADGGSQLQKILFILGAPILGITAYADKQKMFTILQSIATLGAILAFFQGFPTIKYGLMSTAVILGLIYLAKTKYFDTDKWGLVGAVGLVCIAMGFATNAISSPFLFGFFLGIGGLLVAIYSAIQYFHYKIKIALIWVILNIIFSISPLLMLIK